jgi:hypothetical protein
MMTSTRPAEERGGSEGGQRGEGNNIIRRKQKKFTMYRRGRGTGDIEVLKN